MTIEIRELGDDDFFAWLPLFDAYCRFAETSLDDQKALVVWNWLRDAGNPFTGVAAVDAEGALAGIAHYRQVPHSLAATTGVFLDDLFVAPERRRQGIGRALVEHVRTESVRHGSGGVAWETPADDEAARRFSDGLATRTGLVGYELSA